MHKYKNHMEIEAMFRRNLITKEYFISCKYLAVKIDDKENVENKWIPVEKEVYYYLLADERNAYKNETRKKRCWVRGKKGKLVRCPEENKCEECPYIEVYGYAPRTGEDLSIELAAETGMTVPDTFDLEKVICKYELYNAPYAAIRKLDELDYHIALLWMGKMPEHDIAKRIGLKQSAVSYHVTKKIYPFLKGKLEDFR